MDNTFLFNILKAVDVELTSSKLDKLCVYYAMVIEANKTFNLTAILDEEDFAVKHYADSLSGISLFKSGARLLDIGSGAGFPSIPIAIAREDISVTALDSTSKKMSFVSGCAKTLGINNICTISGRAEEQKDLQGSFDIVTARAVSALPILLELAIPMLKPGGIFVAYKTDESELCDAQNALKALGAKHTHTKSLTLPNGEKRALLVFEKVSPTPKQYPRVYGTIKKKPL